MIRLAAFFAIIITPTLAGIFVTATLVVPALYEAVGIPLAAGIGALLGLPVAWFVAKAIRAGVRPA